MKPLLRLLLPVFIASLMIAPTLLDVLPETADWDEEAGRTWTEDLGTAQGSRESSTRGGSTWPQKAYLDVAAAPDPLVTRPGESHRVNFTFEEYNHIKVTLTSVEIAYSTVRNEPLGGARDNRPCQITVGASSTTQWSMNLSVPVDVTKRLLEKGHDMLDTELLFKGTDARGNPVSLSTRLRVELELKVALMVDDELYDAVLDGLRRYERDVRRTVQVEFLERKGNWSTPEALRADLTDLWRDEGITGAILVGYLPYAMWEYIHKDNSSETCPIPVFYEDLDGSFTDINDDGMYDRHHWGPNDGPEIWVSLWMPPWQNIPATHLDPDGQHVGGGLKAVYYNNNDHTDVALQRVDPWVEFFVEEDADAIFDVPDDFTIRWTGHMRADASEEYTLRLRAGGGVRLYVDGELLIDERQNAPWNWRPMDVVKHLEKGWHTIRLDYWENGWGTRWNGTVRLLWSSPSADAAAIGSFLDRAHEFHTGQMANPERALLFMDNAYGVQCRMRDPIHNLHLKPLYGSNVNVAGCQNNTTAHDYMDALALGNELTSVWSHAGSSFHQMVPEDFNDDWPSVTGSSWKVRRRAGGVVTLIWGCHAGDFGDSPDGSTRLDENLAANYAFNMKWGLASAACTRSFGSTFREVYWALANLSYLGMGFFGYADYCYNETLRTKQHPEGGPDRWIDDLVLFGDPFIRLAHYPTNLSITINEGRRHTDSSEVSLSLHAEGAEEMRFKNELGAWTAWEPYAPTKAWSLRGGLGARRVYFEVRNSFGEGIRPASDVISVEPPPPEVLSFKIDGDAELANQTTVELTIDVEALPDPIARSLSNDGRTWSPWEANKATVHWQLAPGDGVKTVSLRVCREGRPLVTEANDSILLDTTPPVTTISLEGHQGEEGWYTGPVLVNITAEDTTSGIASTRYLLDEGPWQEHTSPIEVSEDGQHALRYHSLDAAANVEAAQLMFFNIDATPPVGLTILIDEGAQYATSTTVTLEVSAEDATSGVAKMSFSDGEAWTQWEDFYFSRTYELAEADGERTIHFKVMDVAGNVAEPVTASIVLDTVSPDVVDVHPFDGAEGVPVDTSVSVVLSEPIAEASLGEVPILVLDPNGHAVEGTVDYDAGSLTVTFTPLYELEYYGTYKVSLSGEVTDLAGNPVEVLEWFLTTEGLPPSGPAGLSLGASSIGVHIEWEAPKYPGSGSVLHYRIYKGEGEDPQELVLLDITKATSLFDPNVSVNETYWYAVSAVTTIGEGGMCQAYSILVPPPQPQPPGPGPDVEGDEDGFDFLLYGGLAAVVVMVLVAIGLLYFLRLRKR
jgi:hypothetical protein